MLEIPKRQARLLTDVGCEIGQEIIDELFGQQVENACFFLRDRFPILRGDKPSIRGDGGVR